jgi:hypothetical protein
MKKSDIYEISIKILGIYLFFSSISMLRDLIYLMAMFFQSKSDFGYDVLVEMILFSLLNFAMVIVFASFITFKTKRIVKFVCQKTDFEESAALFAHKKVIYEMAFVIMGLLLIAWTIPDFAFRMMFYFSQDSRVQQGLFETDVVVVAILKMVVGMISITGANYVSAVIVRDRSKSSK